MANTLPSPRRRRSAMFGWWKIFDAGGGPVIMSV